MNDRLKATIAKLEDLGHPFRVIDLGGPAVRTRDVIKNKDIDVNVDEIVKTIMFKSKNQGIFAVSVKGSDRVDYKKVKLLIGDKKISTLRPEEMQDLGWEPGECCPLTVPGPLYIDSSVFAHEQINTGSGDLHFGIEFPTNAIKDYRDDVEVVDVKETTVE